MKSKLTPSIAAGCGVGASGSGHSAGSHGSTAAQMSDPPATAGWAEEPVRELAQRQSGTLEVLLLWHAQTNLVELSVRDLAAGGGFHTEVAPDRAIDAFYHPYVYAPENDSSDPLDGDEAASVDD
jgi:hypothetical protein